LKYLAESGHSTTDTLLRF